MNIKNNFILFIPEHLNQITFAVKRNIEIFYPTTNITIKSHFWDDDIFIS